MVVHNQKSANFFINDHKLFNCNCQSNGGIFCHSVYESPFSAKFSQPFHSKQELLCSKKRRVRTF